MKIEVNGKSYHTNKIKLPYKKACLNCGTCLDEINDIYKIIEDKINEIKKLTEKDEMINEICGGK